MKGVQRSGALQDLVTFIESMDQVQRDEIMAHMAQQKLHAPLLSILKEDQYFLYVDGHYLHRLLFNLATYGTPQTSVFMLELIDQYEESQIGNFSLMDLALNQLQKDKLLSEKSLYALEYLILFTYTPIGMQRLLEIGAIPKMCHVVGDFMECLIERAEMIDRGIIQFEGDVIDEATMLQLLLGIGHALRFLRSFRYTVLGGYVMFMVTDVINSSGVYLVRKFLDSGIRQGLQKSEENEPGGGLFSLGIVQKFGELSQETQTELSARGVAVSFGEVMGHLQEGMYISVEDALKEIQEVEHMLQQYPSPLYQDKNGILLPGLDASVLQSYKLIDARRGMRQNEDNTVMTVNSFFNAIGTIKALSGTLNPKQQLRVFELVSKALLEKDASEMEGNVIANAIRKIFSKDSKPPQQQLFIDTTQDQQPQQQESDSQNSNNKRPKMSIGKADSGEYGIEFVLTEDEQREFEEMKDIMHFNWIEKNAGKLTEQIQRSVNDRWVSVLWNSQEYSWTCCWMAAKVVQGQIMMDQMNRINYLNAKFDPECLKQVCSYLHTLEDIDDRNQVEIQTVLTYLNLCCNTYRQSHAVLIEQDVSDWLYQPSRIKDTQNKLSVISLLKFLLSNSEAVEKMPIHQILRELTIITKQSVNSWGINPLADGVLGIVHSVFGGMIEYGSIYNEDVYEAQEETGLKEYLVSVVLVNQDKKDLCMICQEILILLYATKALYVQAQNLPNEEVTQNFQWLWQNRMSTVFEESIQKADGHLGVLLGTLGSNIAPEMIQQNIVQKAALEFEKQYKQFVSIQRQENKVEEKAKILVMMNHLSRMFESMMRSDRLLLAECLKHGFVLDYIIMLVMMEKDADKMNLPEDLKVLFFNVTRLFLVDQQIRINARAGSEYNIEQILLNQLDILQERTAIVAALEVLVVVWATESFDKGAERATDIDITPVSQNDDADKKTEITVLEKAEKTLTEIKVKKAPSKQLKNQLKAILQQQQSKMSEPKSSTQKSSKPQVQFNVIDESYDSMEGIDMSDPSLFLGGNMDVDQPEKVQMIIRKESPASQRNTNQNLDIQGMWISESDSSKKLMNMVEKLIDLYNNSLRQEVKGVVISVLKEFSENLSTAAPEVMVKYDIHKLALSFLKDPKAIGEAKADAVLLIYNLTNPSTKDEIITPELVQVFLDLVQEQGDNDEFYIQFRYVISQCLAALINDTEKNQLLLDAGVIDIALKLCKEKRDESKGTPSLIHECGLLLFLASIPEEPDNTRQIFVRIFKDLRQILQGNNISLQNVLMAIFMKFVHQNENRKEMVEVGLFQDLMKLVEAGSRNQNSMSYQESMGIAQQGVLAGFAAGIAFYLQQAMPDLKSELAFVNQMLIMCQHGAREARYAALGLLGIMLAQFEDDPELHYRILQCGLVPVIVNIITNKDEPQELVQIATQVWQVVATDDKACASISKGGVSPMLWNSVAIEGLELDEPPPPTLVQFD